MPLPLRIALWRVRHVGVALLVLAAACLVARQLAPPPEPTRQVVVAAGDLPAGRELAPADLRSVDLPVRVAPGTRPTADALVGRRLTVDVPAGLPLVPALLDGARFGLAPPEGTVTVPVRLSDPAIARLLRPGDRVDLVAPGADPPSATPLGSATAAPGAARDDDGGPGEANDPRSSGTAGAVGGTGPAVLAAGALVLGVPDQGERDDDGLGGLGGLTGGASAGSGTALVVVAVAPDEGRRLAAAEGSVGAVLVEGS